MTEQEKQQALENARKMLAARQGYAQPVSLLADPLVAQWGRRIASPKEFVCLIC